MLRREMTLGRVGSGGSGGPIRVARVCSPGVARVPLVSRLSPCASPSPFSSIDRTLRILRGGGVSRVILIVCALSHQQASCHHPRQRRSHIGGG